jgi:hypothetical protein
VLIAGAVVMMLLGGFADGVAFLIAPAQLGDAGHSSATIGLVLSVGSGLFIVCAGLAARGGVRPVSLTTGVVCAAASALVLLPVVSSDSDALVAGMLIARAAPLGVLYAIALPLALRGARRSGIGAGSVNGMLGFAWGTASFAGAVVAGAGLDTPGPQVVYAFLTCCCAGAAAYLAVLRRRSVT